MYHHFERFSCIDILCQVLARHRPSAKFVLEKKRGMPCIRDHAPLRPAIESEHVVYIRNPRVIYLVERSAGYCHDLRGPETSAKKASQPVFAGPRPARKPASCNLHGRKTR